MGNPRPITLGRRIFILCAVAFFLVPGAIGFYAKFRELFLLAQDDVGQFAVMPVVNYLLATFGFCLLFLWATTQGMFHDVEQPKYTFFEQEKMLDDMESDQEDL